MYKSNESYLAESHGLSVGKSHGLRQGRQEGFDDGWTQAVAKMQPQYDAVIRERNELAFALNSLSVIAFSALSSLKNAPPQHRITAAEIYAKEVNRLTRAGSNAPGAIRVVPHTDPALLAHEPDLACLMKRWFEEALALANKNPSNSHSPSP